MRVLIVDDEEPARDRLREMLRPFGDMEVVGEASDGQEAIGKIGKLKPELVLMDIQMPGCSGLEVAASLPEPRPRIIFCTAFDQYAVDAFELHALDYLLKPVARTRLEASLQRARNQPAPDETALTKALRQTAPAARFLARSRGRVRVIPQKDVFYFASEQGLSKLCTAQHEYWMDPTLTELEKRADPAQFFRISRAALVRLDAVREVIPLIGGHGQLELRNSIRLDVSRRRMKELLARLQGMP